ncbi:MAG: glutamate--tRNA ligase [Myxococcales bacterium]|nr:glutamate--tRNA ligase [Myxococcales bacterium]
MTVRVRFAPSPTGYLHLGSARTALYNWLWARQNGGSFVLRVEDTDQERSTQEAEAAIFDSMGWLGLDWDEGPNVGGDHGPYFQMQRLEIYREHVDTLIARDAAYRCYCTAEDLKKAREAHTAATGNDHGFRYPGTCRERADEPDREHVVRLKVPTEGSVGWKDLVKGEIEFGWETQQDAVLMRRNGVPLYNLGAVVDDLTMGITLIARGDDHVINTPQQIRMYEALGAPVPQMAHLPMILAPSGEKLSKRHAAVGVLDYQELGYVPDAVLNYLVRLGWSHGDQEIFTRDELVEKFDWEHVGHTGSKYDLKKFQHVQASHLRMLEPADVAALSQRWVTERGLSVAEDDPRLVAATELVMPRAGTFIEVAEAVDYFFRDTPEVDPKAAKKFLTAERAERLTALVTQLEAVEGWRRDGLEQHVMAWLQAEDIPLKEIAQPARVALTGRKASPGLFDVMEVLGRDRSLERLAAGADRARAAG